VCVDMYNQMYKKYLIKNEFWQCTRRNGQEAMSEGSWFMKHSPEFGGIYVKVLQEQRGVEVFCNNERRLFSNFVELDSYLDRLNTTINQTDNNEFYSILNRKMTSKLLRSLPI
jgi:hypothetical protein